MRALTGPPIARYERCAVVVVRPHCEHTRHRGRDGVAGASLVAGGGDNEDVALRSRLQRVPRTLESESRSACCEALILIMLALWAMALSMPAANSSWVQICGTPGAAAAKIGIEEIVHPGAIPGTMRSLDPEMIEWTCVPCSVAPLRASPGGEATEARSTGPSRTAMTMSRRPLVNAQRRSKPARRDVNSAVTVGSDIGAMTRGKWFRRQFVRIGRNVGICPMKVPARDPARGRQQ